MRKLSEADTRMVIDQQIRESGWRFEDGTIMTEYTITKGRIQAHGGHGKSLSADYVLRYKGKRIAVIEAKRWDNHLTEGVSQAIEYAKLLQIRYTYATNGQGFYEIDTVENKQRELSTDEFPSPEELWEKTYPEQDDWRDRFASIPQSGKFEPRYYQHNAIENALKAISEDKKRILLTLATGTGKTAIAFQIVWKLFQTKWSLSAPEKFRLPRILFLADRNNLADQAFNSFDAFPKDALARISAKEVRKNGHPQMNASVFFTIFQTFMVQKDKTVTDKENFSSKDFLFGAYPENFFDLIIVDECHRGGANDESRWRGILEYFSPAVQIGLTATPKRKQNEDTYDYFGEPVYSYSLKQGVEDGFLTPFRVRQHWSTIDDYVYNSDDEVLKGEIEEEKRYEEDDFSSGRRRISMPQRDKLRVKIFLDDINQNEKTIVFCADQQHALEIRDLINQMAGSSDVNYCVRVTADEGKRGKQKLEEFRDNERRIPTILTSSRMLSTGVDARNVRHIVLMRPIKSMIEFKQIIGRGTRTFDGKNYFTIHDFVKAHRKFNDPGWDDEPIEVEISEKEERVPSKPREPKEPKPEMIKVKLSDGNERSIQNMSVTTFMDASGKPITAEEFLNKLYGELPKLFTDEIELRKIWSVPSTRKKLLEELSDLGFEQEHLKEMRSIISAEKSDIFDVLSYVRYKAPILTREERVNAAKKQVQVEFNDSQQIFINYILKQYIDQGVEELNLEKINPYLEIVYGSTMDAISELGSPSEIRNIFTNFQKHLYLAEISG